MGTLTVGVSRDKALEVLKQYNAEPFHLRHAYTVEAVMGWYADELGYGADREFWATAGLMHDVDFEQWPDEHCVKAPELLAAAGFTPVLEHEICDGKQQGRSYHQESGSRKDGDDYRDGGRRKRRFRKG